MTELKAVVAISENYVIANKNGIPWDIEEDSKHYKNTVKGNITISGRRTYEVSSEGATGDKQVVLTRNKNWSSSYDDVYKANSISEAINIARDLANSDQDIFVIGGENVYRSFLDKYDEMIISHIDGVYEGNTYFPRFDESKWDINKREEFEKFNIIWYRPK